MSVALGIVKSTALYLFLAMLACWIAFDADVAGALSNPKSFSDFFVASGVWALGVLVLSILLGALMTYLKKRFMPRRYHMLSVGDSVVGGIGYAFKNPFDGLRLLFWKMKQNDPGMVGVPAFMSWAFSVFHLCWAVVLILYIAVGLIVVGVT